MENILFYYIIFGISFVLTSYITIYRPAMKMSAQALVDLLNVNSSEFVLGKAKIFVSWPYRLFTIIIYSIAVFLLFPIVAYGVISNNTKLIEGFSSGLIKGLLEVNKDE